MIPSHPIRQKEEGAVVFTPSSPSSPQLIWIAVPVDIGTNFGVRLSESLTLSFQMALFAHWKLCLFDRAVGSSIYLRFFFP